MKPTAKMRAALKQLAAADGPIEVGGQPTRQRLAKYGLADWAGPYSAMSPWDRPMVITAAGRAALEQKP